MKDNFYIYAGLFILGIFVYVSHQEIMSEIRTSERHASIERDEILCILDDECTEPTLEELLIELDQLQTQE